MHFIYSISKQLILMLLKTRPLRFHSYMDPVNGYIELDTISMEQVVCGGWSIEPHKEPLIVSYYIDNLLICN